MANSWKKPSSATRGSHEVRVFAWICVRAASFESPLFQSFLRDRGVELVVPELDEDRFEQLTITGQLKVVERAGRVPDPSA